jgi:shikimate dehydrogenase
MADFPHFLLVGSPVAHSLSPLMHNLAAKYYGLSVRYHAVKVEEKAIPQLASWLYKKQLKGMNVTIPHKRSMLKYVDAAAGPCEEIGAINTVVKQEDALIGYNTDIDGFCQPLYTFQSRLKDRCAIVFGTGGAARAVIYGLKRLHLRKIVLVSRSPSNKTPENWPGGEITIVSYDEWQDYAKETALFVNTTPLGMSPKVQESPVKEAEKQLLSGKICYDIVYNPLKTVFLQRAEKVQATTISGLEMFIRQGSRSFELWTGKNFPVDLVRNELTKTLTNAR